LIAHDDKKDLVYLDETGVGRSDIEMFSWIKKGTVRSIQVVGKRSKRVNVIAAKSQSEIIAPFLFEASLTTTLFEIYIEKALCPTLRKSQVVIMDHATFHKSQIIKDLIEEKGCTLLYLPPYSPERNPIEKYWSLLKRKIKKFRLTIEDIYEAITLALRETQEIRQT